MFEIVFNRNYYLFEMKTSTSNLFLLVLAAAVFGFTLTSCKKEKPTVAKIRVVDTSGQTVDNALVRLYATSTMSPPTGSIVINDTIFTGPNGYATFDYTDDFKLGQSGFAVLDIEVLSETFVGTGIIKVEEEKTNEETVIIQ